MKAGSRRSAVGMLCAAILGAGSAVGAQSVSVDSVRFNVLVSEVELEPPLAEELADGSPAPTRVGHASIATTDGRGLRIRFPSPAAPIVGVLRRRIPRLWSLEVPPDAVAPQVILRLEDPNGAANILACGEDQRLRVPAYLRSLQPDTRTGADGTVYSTGGAMLEIPTSGITVACRLEGRIVVILEAP